MKTFEGAKRRFKVRYYPRGRVVISNKGEIIIYTDHEIDSNNNYVPGLKVGDGTTPAIDLPFVDSILRQTLLNHISDQEVHITQTERERWDNKLNLEYDSETLIFNRN